LTQVFLAVSVLASKDVGRDPRYKEGSKQFFFEKKNQKTFVH
jgi:hypothetical protein